MTELDIPRWIEVLGIVLDSDDKVKYVIPGHRKIWSREKLDMWRDYIVNLWEGVQTAKAEDLDLNKVIARFPLEEKYHYLKNLGHSDAALERFQRNNVIAFWRQLFTNAVSVVEKTIEQSGIETAISKYREMKSDIKGEYYFDEASFNALGYRLINQGKIKEAIEIFKLNVEAYPESWNVYDSLGEAYMNDGDKEFAIRNYKRSLELNPDNENGKMMLKRFEKMK
ncbi:MAG: tetratricopeptide repeat protein [bacterium]|nr:MAG: tetratricopeptide repeat protein [bacterium]